jgi:hypothetical protein
MAVYAVADAYYGDITGITYSVSRYPLLSWKISEQPLNIYPHKSTPDFAMLR